MSVLEGGTELKPTIFLDGDSYIVSPDKFRGEPEYAPVFYDRASSGEVLKRLPNAQGFVSLIPIGDEDRIAYPDLRAILYVLLLEDDDGHVTTARIHTEDEANRARELQYEVANTAVLEQVRRLLDTEPASELVPIIRRCAGSAELSDAVISIVHNYLPWGWWLLAGHWGKSPEYQAHNVTRYLTMHIYTQSGPAAKKLLDAALRDRGVCRSRFHAL